MTHIAMEAITMLLSSVNTIYFYGLFSMAMLNHQRVYDMLYVIAPITPGFSLSHLSRDPKNQRPIQRICRSQRQIFLTTMLWFAKWSNIYGFRGTLFGK